MNNKAVNKLVTLPFIIAGIVFVVAGVYLYKSNTNFMNNARESVATINKADCDDGGCQYTISFIASEKEYSLSYSKYNSSYKVGDEINVYYDINNPSNFKCDYSNNIAYVFMGLGTLIVIVGLFIMIKKNIKYRSYLNVKSSGIRIDAKIIGIEMDNNVIKDGVNPYFIICSGINPITREEETYNSGDIWFDVRKIIEENRIETLPVYVDENIASNYSVDTSVLNTYVK